MPRKCRMSQQLRYTTRSYGDNSWHYASGASQAVARLVAADSVSEGACSRSGGLKDGLGHSQRCRRGTVGVSCAVREHVRGGRWAWVDTTMSGPRYPSLGSFCSFG